MYIKIEQCAGLLASPPARLPPPPCQTPLPPHLLHSCTEGLAAEYHYPVIVLDFKLSEGECRACQLPPLVDEAHQRAEVLLLQQVWRGLAQHFHADL